MFITCNGCNSKMRVPDRAAGKRVKCPKCASVVRVPAAPKTEEAAAEPEAVGVSAKPLPPLPAAEPEPTEEADDANEKVSKPSAAVKPPPLVARRSSSKAEVDEEDQPPPSRRRRRDDDDDDDDDLGISRRSRRRPGVDTSSLATTSMVLGIVSISFGSIGVCCCPLVFEAVGCLCGILAIVFGFMGKTPGNEGTAMTGIICGGIGVVCLPIAIAVQLLFLSLHFGMGFNNF